LRVSAGPAGFPYFEPQFLASPDKLFDHLLESIEWDERMKARKTDSFGVSYADAGRKRYRTIGFTQFQNWKGPGRASA